MKKVIITNAEIIPLQNGNPDLYRSHQLSDGKMLVAFKVKTKQTDRAESKAVLFLDVTKFADHQQDADNIIRHIQLGSICEIEGYETMRKGSKPDANGRDKYFQNIIINKFTPLSSSSTPASNNDNSPWD